jgi:protein TonB
MYPKIAQMRGWQGEVVLELQLSQDGQLTSSKVIRSSGFDVLDSESLEMVKRASPFPVPPEILKNRSFNILVPIRFKLD